MYGNHHWRYPVQRGDVWGVGPHRFMCADIENDSVAKMFESMPGHVQVIYSDPPWNTGNYNMFRTKAGIPYGNYSSFISRFVGMAAWLTPTDIYLQMGVPSMPIFEGKLEEIGYHCCGLWEMSYEAGVMQLYHGSLLGISDIDDPEEGAAVPWAISRSCSPGSIVFDPCVGGGTTAVVAARHGCIGYGCELIPAKLALCLHRMRQQTKRQPKLLYRYD